MPEETNTPIGSCGNCGQSWETAEKHITQYDETRGCFPLCQDCWATLTPETRKPFYLRHIEEIGADAATTVLIMNAVQDGK